MQIRGLPSSLFGETRKFHVLLSIFTSGRVCIPSRQPEGQSIKHSLIQYDLSLTSRPGIMDSPNVRARTRGERPEQLLDLDVAL